MYGTRKFDLRYIIEEFHISIVTCGWDNFKWTTLVLSDQLRSKDQGEDEEEEGSRGGESGDEADNVTDDVGDDTVEREDIPTEDVIASDDGRFMDCNPPIWDPRVYWLIVIERKISIAVAKWEMIVFRVEGCVGNWVYIPSACFNACWHD